MFKLIITVATFCVLLFLSPPGVAAVVEMPLSGQATQMMGLEGEARFQFAVDAPKDRKSEPKLVLRWARSQLINAEKSRISIRIDGRNLQSLRLADLRGDVHQVKLDGLSGGDHVISVVVILHVDGDPCLQLRRDDAWFTVLPTSTIAWERRISLQKTGQVSDFPKTWARLADGRSGVILEQNAPLDAQGIGAYLDADHLLRRWGYWPEPEQSARTVGRIRLTLAEQLGANHPALGRLTALPDSRFVLAAESGGVLEVVGRDTTALREGLLLLGNDQSRSLCRTSMCTGGPQIPLESIAPGGGLAAADRAESTRVWQLGESDQPRGWVISGAGRHVMQFVWRRPGAWRVKEWPTLQLLANVSDSAALDQVLSTLTVRINGRPVATYSFANWKSGRADIKVPSDIWAASEWVFELVTNITPVNSQACTVKDVEGAWVTVAPETALWVAREDQVIDSVANFFDQSTKKGLPRLNVENPTLPRLAAVASALFPFVQSRPGSPPAERRWEPVDSKGCGNQRCITVSDASPPEAPLKLSSLTWIDTSAQLRVPQIPATGTLAVFHLLEKPPREAQLVLVAGPTSPLIAAMEPPDYVGLTGAIALFDQRWHILETAVGGSTRPHADKVRSVDKNISGEQRKLRWLNLVWAALSIVLLLGLLIFLWRRPAGKKADEGWEIHP